MVFWSLAQPSTRWPRAADFCMPSQPCRALEDPRKRTGNSASFAFCAVFFAPDFPLWIKWEILKTQGHGWRGYDEARGRFFAPLGAEVKKGADHNSRPRSTTSLRPT